MQPLVATVKKGLCGGDYGARRSGRTHMHTHTHALLTQSGSRHTEMLLDCSPSKGLRTGLHCACDGRACQKADDRSILAVESSPWAAG